MQMSGWKSQASEAARLQDSLQTKNLEIFLLHSQTQALFLMNLALNQLLMRFFFVIELGGKVDI